MSGRRKFQFYAAAAQTTVSPQFQIFYFQVLKSDANLIQIRIEYMNTVKSVQFLIMFNRFLPLTTVVNLIHRISGTLTAQHTHHLFSGPGAHVSA